MIRSRELIGRKVASPEGKHIGHVESVRFEPSGECIEGITYTKEGFLAKKMYVPYDMIRAIGSVVILKDYGIPAVKVNTGPDIGVLGGMDSEFGYISEVFFDERTGGIVSYEVAKSFWEDLKYGRGKIGLYKAPFKNMQVDMQEMGKE